MCLRPPPCDQCMFRTVRALAVAGCWCRPLLDHIRRVGLSNKNSGLQCRARSVIGRPNQLRTAPLIGVRCPRSRPLRSRTRQRQVALAPGLVRATLGAVRAIRGRPCLRLSHQLRHMGPVRHIAALLGIVGFGRGPILRLRLQAHRALRAVFHRPLAGHKFRRNMTPAVRHVGGHPHCNFGRQSRRALGVRPLLCFRVDLAHVPRAAADIRGCPRPAKPSKTTFPAYGWRPRRSLKE